MQPFRRITVPLGKPDGAAKLTKCAVLVQRFTFRRAAVCAFVVENLAVGLDVVEPHLIRTA